MFGIAYAHVISRVAFKMDAVRVETTMPYLGPCRPFLFNYVPSQVDKQEVWNINSIVNRENTTSGENRK